MLLVSGALLMAVPSLALFQANGIAMSDRPLIVLSLEGLATSAVSCYGSSWNSTPAIDEIAASGCVWDRWIASNDQPLEVLKQWLSPVPSAPGDWLPRWESRGSVELITDDPRIIDQGIDARFHQTLLVESDESSEAASEIAETQLGRLIASAIERDADQDWGVLWIHSRFLSERWDAPRDLFPLEETEPDDSPSEEVELLGEGETDPTAGDLEQLPLIFEAVCPPQIELGDQPHCDLASTWMRTYGCQIRLLDALIDILLQSLRRDDPQVVLAGTSGLSLGQNGWIGHSSGPLRSCDLRLPLVVSHRGPIRSPLLTASDTFAQILDSLASDREPLIQPNQWCRGGGEFDPRVVTESTRAKKVVTTSRWSFIRDLDSTNHLYLKPDDVEDANDVGRLRSDVIDEINAADC